MTYPHPTCSFPLPPDHLRPHHLDSVGYLQLDLHPDSLQKIEKHEKQTKQTKRETGIQCQ